MRRALLAVWVALAGCTEPSAQTKVSVFAASSLTEAFSALAKRFEAEHPDVDVQLAFAGSQVLRLQIEQGAPAALFASANPAHVEALEAAGLVRASSVFAKNALVAVVSSQSELRKFEDLARAERVVVGTTAVPVGSYTRRAFAALRARGQGSLVDHLEAHVVSEESNVRLVRAKVALGAADVAFVYRTDAVASAKVRVIELPAGLGAEVRYMIGEIGDIRPEAKAFAQFVIAPPGQRILAAHGFLPPERVTDEAASGGAPANAAAPPVVAADGAQPRPTGAR